MLIAQYAGVGEICPLFEVETASGGSLDTGSLYFSYQLQNRAGFNIPSISDLISYATNQKIIITIPEMPDGWDIHYFIISAGTTSDPSNHVQIARIPGFQYGIGIEPQSVKTVLPTTLELTRNSHLLLAPSVVSTAALPTGLDRLDGQVRYITDLAIFVEYRADSDLPPSPNVVATDIGQWVRIGGASTYVSNTRSGVGSDRPIVSINPVTTIPTPPYPGETLSKYLPGWEAKYWIYNDNANALPAGTEFGVELEYNNKRSPDLLSGLFMVKFIGFVGTDGNIRTQDGDGRDFPNLGAFFPWTPKLTTPFITIDDLQPGEALALAVKPFFSVAELNNEVAPKSVLGVFPVTRIQSGDYNPLGKLLPTGTIFDIGSRYRVVPGTGLSYDVLSGCALIGGYDFPEKPRRSFGGLQPNTAGQKIIINGNAAVFTETPTYAPSASEGIRAIVSTLSGESSPGGWSSYTALATGVAVTLSYPSTADGVGTIRSDYPDVLAGNNKGAFNPYGVNIYLQRQDTLEIRKFTGFNVVAATTQQFTITDWTAGTVTSLPTADADFSLFSPLSGAIVPAITGNFPSTNYRVACSFVYDGNQITSISHASPPCVKEFEGDFQPPTITFGTISTLPPGSEATAENVGTGNMAIINLGLPSGANAYTLTTEDFIQPNVNENVEIEVLNNSWIAIGQIIFIEVGGTYELISKTSTDIIEVKNLGYDNNAEHAETISSNSLITGSGVRGAEGFVGNNAYTQTTTSFVQPSIFDTVTIDVVNSDWAIINQYIFIEDAGYYQIDSVPNSTSIIIINLGYSDNAAAGATITASKKVSPAGIKGDIGTTGSVSSASSIILEYTTIPSTLANESALYVDVGDGLLKVREQSNGAVKKIALLDSDLWKYNLFYG